MQPLTGPEVVGERKKISEGFLQWKSELTYALHQCCEQCHTDFHHSTHCAKTVQLSLSSAAVSVPLLCLFRAVSGETENFMVNFGFPFSKDNSPKGEVG